MKQKYEGSAEPCGKLGSEFFPLTVFVNRKERGQDERSTEHWVCLAVPSFRELLEKALALKPRIVLMDLHMRDKYKFKPEFVRSELQASAEHVLAMSRSYDDEAVGLSNSYGASLLLDKSKLITDLVRTVEKLCA